MVNGRVGIIVDRGAEENIFVLLQIAAFFDSGGVKFALLYTRKLSPLSPIRPMGISCVNVRPRIDHYALRRPQGFKGASSNPARTGTHSVRIGRFFPPHLWFGSLQAI